jgi:hypothetical protein
MNRILLVLLVCCCGTNAFSQQQRKEFKLIIEIDDQLAVGGVTAPKLILTDKRDSVKTLSAGYDPGTLWVDGNNAVDLIKRAKQIVFSFYYINPSNSDAGYYTYNIELKKDWITSSYCVLRVYNLDKRKYKRSYGPLSPTQNYTFSIDFPGYQMMPISKR